jgi:hypothetical protein
MLRSHFMPQKHYYFSVSGTHFITTHKILVLFTGTTVSTSDPPTISLQPSNIYIYMNHGLNYMSLEAIPLLYLLISSVSAIIVVAMQTFGNAIAT